VTFYEIVFPENISYGSSGGPGFHTKIVSTESGFEYRQQVWQRTRGKWNAAHGLKIPSDYRALISFWYAVGAGRANGFRWKDWLDYRDDGKGVLATNAAGFLQLAKVYTPPAAIVAGAPTPTFTRFIDKPVPSTITLQHGGNVDYATGLVSGASIGDTWTGQFHTPARFDVDELDMSIDQPWGASDADGNVADVSPSWRSIPILELKLKAPTPSAARVSQLVVQVMRSKSFGPAAGRVSQIVIQVMRSRT
jgi:uncharacterized protein (TIGR02217 family)